MADNQPDKITKLQYIQQQLNGCEVQSLSQEGVVGINKGRAYRDGEDISDTLSEEDWNDLWIEYLENERGQI